MLGLCFNLVAYLRVRSTQSGLGSCFHDQNCFDFRHLSSTTYTCVCLLRRDAPMMAAYLKICCRVPSAVPWRAGTRTAFRTWAGCCSFRWSIKPERQRYITTALYCYSIVTLPTYLLTDFRRWITNTFGKSLWCLNDDPIILKANRSIHGVSKNQKCFVIHEPTDPSSSL